MGRALGLALAVPAWATSLALLPAGLGAAAVLRAVTTPRRYCAERGA